MSTDGIAPPTTVVACPCKHRSPPLGTNDVCPYEPGITCGGVNHCAICRGNRPRTEDAPLEPDSIVGWVSGPDGIYEVATSSGQAIPREATTERRPVNQALYRCCEILADAIQSGQWRDKEEALECWRLLRGDVERHVSEDERNRRELVQWLVEVISHRPRPEFALVRWLAELTKAEPRLEFDEDFLHGVAGRVEEIRHHDGAERLAFARHIAEQCARAAKVTGWREREQS